MILGPSQLRGGGSGIPAGLRQAHTRGTWEELGAGTGKGRKGQAPCASPLYIGVEGAGFKPSKHLEALAKGEEGNPSFPFPTDRHPHFLGILILSLRDMILFIVRGIMVHLDQGCGTLPPPPTFMWVPMQVGPTPEPSRTFPVQYQKILNIFRWPK
jgi:hypothetical protein